MSAIYMICERCGETYLAGVVGMTPWPAHVCLAAEKLSCSEAYCIYDDDPTRCAYPHCCDPFLFSPVPLPGTPEGDS